MEWEEGVRMAGEIRFMIQKEHKLVAKMRGRKEDYEGVRRMRKQLKEIEEVLYKIDRERYVKEYIKESLYVNYK